MHMLVRVDMVEREPGGVEPLELGADLGGEPAARAGPKKKAQSGAQGIVVEPAVAAHETPELIRRQRRRAVDQHKVQPDAQRAEATCPCDRIRRGRRADHQAGARQNAVAMRLLDRVVGCDIAAEIVSRNDQPPCRQPQLAISRSRRNWKNSTPSRTRRRIISGLFSISPSSDAILRRRK